MMHDHGLSQDDINDIRDLLVRFPEIETAKIFGSRAKGKYKKGSDIDIALFGVHLADQTISEISYQLNQETLMPYHFDIFCYNTATNIDLKDHIDRGGKSIYQKEC